VKEGWAPLIDTYLKEEKNLARILLLVDIRHEPSALDMLMVDFMVRQNIPFSVVATKADKVGKSRIFGHIGNIAASLKLGRDNIMPVSNTDKTGAAKLVELIAQIVM
jgi:GTP-binding protein